MCLHRNITKNNTFIMSNYLNDPREMTIRPESGVTLEQDNRVETMYHWGAAVLDLCDFPVSEYMKTIFYTLPYQE